MLGAVLDGRYTLIGRIGAGGMGEVWRARDERLARDVAVKLLTLPTSASGPQRERLLAMFLREARAAASLDSSYIVPVFDHGRADDAPYLVMPLLAGRTVRELLAAEGPPPPRRTADIAGQICRALAFAHRAGIIHRDIKPANVMLTTEGTVKVLDFGIAKFIGAATDGGYLTGTSDSPVGTLQYMAPERFTRRGDDRPADVYSLGCMVYEMLTGAPPFDGVSAVALMHDHVYEPAPPLSQRRPDIGVQWDGLVARMLAKPPELRPTAEEACRAFETLTEPSVPPEPAPGTSPARPLLPPPPSSAPRTAPHSASRSTPPSTVPSVVPAPEPGADATAVPEPGASAAAEPPVVDPEHPSPPAPPGGAGAGDVVGGGAGTGAGGVAEAGAGTRGHPPMPTSPVPAPPVAAPAVPASFAPTPSMPAPAAAAPASARPPAAAPAEPVGAPVATPLAAPVIAAAPAAGEPPRRRWWFGAVAVTAVAALIAALMVLDPFGDDSGTGGGGAGQGVPADRKSRQKPAPVADVAQTSSFTVGNATDSQGPARPVTDARRGGVVRVVEKGEPFSLGRGRPFGETLSSATRLVYRTLTGLKTEPDGTVKLVGDMARDSGRSSADGRTWTFKLKPNLTYEDGSAVRPVDFRRAMEKALEADNRGSQGILNRLLGVEFDGALDAGTFESSDNLTVTFRLEYPCADFNVLMSDLSPLPEVGDGGEVPATGPYKIAARHPEGVSLARNEEWRAESDALRTAYPDRFEIEEGVSAGDARSRVANAAEREAIAAPSIPFAQQATDEESGSLAWTTEIPAARVESYVINTERVRDVAVRRAIATVMPVQEVLQASGERGKVAHHLMPPGLKGSRAFDIYGAGPHGNPEKARRILRDAGKVGFQISLGSADIGPVEQAVKDGLESAGFQVLVKRIDRSELPFPQDGDFDIFAMRLGGYFLPVSSASFYHLFDGRRGPPFVMNMAQLRSADVDAAIDSAISAKTIEEAGVLWSAVDREVMQQAAFIPMYIREETYLRSPVLQGLQAGLGGLSLLNAYVE
ncbi:ABC transporter substrate-binding protein [Streptomyces sp. HSW2009]|uniref:protein kinase domain-containing protein n=1 Tax=Streptomyces sp. HSW2009 TaxID=3142890 RepID=UPI0032ED0795